MELCHFESCYAVECFWEIRADHFRMPKSCFLPIERFELTFGCPNHRPKVTQLGGLSIYSDLVSHHACNLSLLAWDIQKGSRVPKDQILVEKCIFMCYGIFFSPPLSYDQCLHELEEPLDDPRRMTISSCDQCGVDPVCFIFFLSR